MGPSSNIVGVQPIFASASADTCSCPITFICSSALELDARRLWGAWVKGLKRELDRVLLSTGSQRVQLAGQKLSSFWQPGFNDHVLRNDESYAQKWEYVFQNPVRGGLVARAEDWPYAGEIIRIDRTVML